VEFNIFTEELKNALVARGIPEETAERHVINLKRSFTPQDLNEIESINSIAEVQKLADSISAIIHKNTQVSVAENSQPQPTPPTADTPADLAVVENEDKSIQQIESTQKTQRVIVEDDMFSEPEPQPTTRGVTIFWVGLLLTLPLTLGILGGIFGAFAALFIGLIAMILAGIVVLVAVAGVGSCLSLVGIIYGVTQLFSFVTAGIYEIGLGVTIAGIALFVSVVIYNFSIRFLPWLISLVGRLFGFVCVHLKILFNFVRRECYKL